MISELERLPPYLQKAAVEHRLRQVQRSRPAAEIWKPFVGKPQEVAFYSPADVLFYGGAAGGGKSTMLLGLGFTQHLDTIIYRRKYTQLAGLIKEGNKIMKPLGIRYVGGGKRAWEDIPGEGGRTRTVALGAVQYEEDVENFQGNPHDLVAFDELPHFTEFQFRFLTGWLRTDVPGQRTRIVGGGNPPLSVEEEWVIDYFAPWLDDDYIGEKAEPGELRWFISYNNEDIEVAGPEPEFMHGESIKPLSRTFIPSRIQDNPVLMATNYLTQLQSLPDEQKNPLLYGKFQRFTGTHPWQTIPTEWVMLAQERGRMGHRPEVALRAMGIDVARGGADETVLAKLYGTWFELVTEPGKATPDGDAVARLVLDHREMCDQLGIDALGVGWSPYDVLKKVIPIYAINAGAASIGHDQSGKFSFFNLRTQMWWRFREALNPNSGENIALPPDRQLRVDLCAPRYKLVGAKYQVESKDDIKERIGRSPDRGDAVVMAWHMAQSAGSGIRIFGEDGLIDSLDDDFF